MKTVTRNVRLTTSPVRFVGNEADLDREPGEGRSVVVPAVVFAKAVAWAETRGFRAPRGGTYLPGQTKEFVLALREALAELKNPPPAPRRRSLVAAAGQLREFFALAPNLRALNRVLALLDDGGALDVTEA